MYNKTKFKKHVYCISKLHFFKQTIINSFNKRHVLMIKYLLKIKYYYPNNIAKAVISKVHPTFTANLLKALATFNLRNLL